MPTYKIKVREVLHHHNADVEIEAESLKDAMAQLAELVPSPDFYWGARTRDMMVLELVVDDKPTVLTDWSSDGTMWPMELVKDGHVWAGDGEDGGEYLMENMPLLVKGLISEEENGPVDWG